MAEKGSIPVPAAGDWFHYPAVNTIATKTLTGRADASWCVSGIVWAFDVAPATLEELTLQSPSAGNHIRIPVREAGSFQLQFTPPLRFPPGADVVLALSAGAAGEQGMVGFTGAYIE